MAIKVERVPTGLTLILNWLNKEHHQRRLLFILTLVSRLAYFVFSNPYDRFRISGDSLWYIQRGWLILHNALPATLSNVGPLYPLVLAVAWVVFPDTLKPTDPALVPAAYLALIRLVQIVLSLLIVRLSYQLTYRLTGDHRPSIIAAIGMGLGPAFIAEPFNILTETLFMALLVLAIWFYMVALEHFSARQFAVAGFILGLAALARPILILFPLCLIPHLLIRTGPQFRKTCLGAFLGVFLLALLTWALYMYQGTRSWIPEGFFPNLWIGSLGSGIFEGPEATDKLRQGFEDSNAGYAGEAARIIAADPVGWLSLRARNTVEAVLRPHGPDNLLKLKIKQAFTEWLQHDRSLLGLWALINISGFWGKIAIYVFHYTALVFGVIGGWSSLRQWRKFYVPFLVIVYFFGTYGILTILPRYVFPTQIFFWLFAGIGIVGVWESLLHWQTALTVMQKHHTL